MGADVDARFEVEHRLSGWTLAWARLVAREGAVEAAAGARAEHARRARERYGREEVTADPTVAAVRRLFREAGTDPTRYRPSSEALLRRVLRGEELPAIHPLVDLNNCLSIALAVPSCVMAAGSFAGRLRLRRGEAGERLDSLRGDFDLAGKVLLEDERGPLGTPITDSRRVAVQPTTREGWLVAYLPEGELGAGAVEEALAALTAIAVAKEVFATGGGPGARTGLEAAR
jgi:DNA/RNA-binding domain of Phe-tRNA-synthetase-like protein